VEAIVITTSSKRQNLSILFRLMLTVNHHFHPFHLKSFKKTNSHTHKIKTKNHQDDGTSSK